MNILWKSIIGALLTALIAWASKRGNIRPRHLAPLPYFRLDRTLFSGYQRRSPELSGSQSGRDEDTPRLLRIFMGRLLRHPKGRIQNRLAFRSGRLIHRRPRKLFITQTRRLNIIILS